MTSCFDSVFVALVCISLVLCLPQAMNKKMDIIKGLFVACRFSEARYIVR